MGDACNYEIPYTPAQVARIRFDSWRIKSDSPNGASWWAKSGIQKTPSAGTTTLAWRFRNGTVDLDYELHVVCSLHFPQAQGRKGVTMDFAIILIVSNTLLAAFIYFVVTRIWQD